MSGRKNSAVKATKKHGKRKPKIMWCQFHGVGMHNTVDCKQ